MTIKDTGKVTFRLWFWLSPFMWLRRGTTFATAPRKTENCEGKEATTKERA